MHYYFTVEDWWHKSGVVTHMGHDGAVAGSGHCAYWATEPGWATSPLVGTDANVATRRRRAAPFAATGGYSSMMNPRCFPTIPTWYVFIW